MSEIVKETAEYVEMSDSITLSIVKDGTAGTSINMKTGVTSKDNLPDTGVSMGDSYIIGGHLWTYTGATTTDNTHHNGFTDCGQVSGEAGKNNYVHVAWCKESDFDTSTKKPKSESVIKLDNSDGVSYEYMGTWVSETKEDTAAEALSMATWVYVKGDKGDDGSTYDIYLSASVLKGDSTGKLNDSDTVPVTAKVVKITNGTATEVTDTNEAYFTISWTETGGDIVSYSRDNKTEFTVETFDARGSYVKTWNFSLYVGGVFLKTVTLPVIRDGKDGDGTATTVYTIEPCANFEATGRLKDASKIEVSFSGDVQVYKTTGDKKEPCNSGKGVFVDYFRLSIGNNNYDGSAVFTLHDGYYYKVSKTISYDISTDKNNIPGSATITVYDLISGSTVGNQLASLVVPISLNAGAIQKIDTKLGEITNTTVSMRGEITQIKQGQGEINLKVQDLQNGAIDTSKPHTSSQVDFTSLSADNFYPVLIRFKDDGGVRHAVEISRPLDGKYGTGKSYMTHGNGFSFRLLFSDVANDWGSREDGQLRIESISQYCTSPSDTAICPKIVQYYNFSIIVAWLRGGSKYDITVDCTDAYISGIWPYMMQVASNPSWVPDAVRFAPGNWTTAQVNAQGGNSYNLLKHDDGGFYADTDNEYLYRFGSLTAGNTFAIVGQPKDSKVWFMATWHITSVSGSKVYVDVSTYGLLWQAQNPLGIWMDALGYIKTGASYPKSTWDSQDEFGTSEDVDNTAVHAGWAVPRAILVIGKESSATNGVYRDRAVLEAVQSCTEGSSVSFYSNTYFDVSPLYGTDGRRNVKTDLLATGIDIKSHKMTLTADRTVFQTNSGQEVAVFTGDGLNTELVHARELSTIDTSTKKGVVIKNAMAYFFGTNGVANIEFGVNDKGLAVLSYYDKNHKFLYNLGPGGIEAKDVRTSSVLTYKAISVDTIIKKSGHDYSFSVTTQNVNGISYDSCVPTDYEYLIFGGDEEDQSEEFFTPGYSPTKLGSIPLYNYIAGKNSATSYAADSRYGLTTERAAEAADGKWFAGMPFGDGNGALRNLANGVYFLDIYTTVKCGDYNGEHHPYMCIDYLEITDGVAERKALYTSAWV